MIKVIFFSSSKCAVCLSLKERLKRVVEDYGIEIEEINLEEKRDKAAKYMVFSVPTVVVEVDGKESGRWSGVFSVNEIETFLERIIGFIY
ncbi:Thioredoxin domain-containing protein [Desulfurobacterium pacificum]|uniref:Thioredoxin domain-containing protein n=1 Tax=Desulfurobacterium pacificum TaxID=240166 RepID=A0ABY1NTU9_9BACT|nr:thioredoxin family protein [Desulfurobacterium pacificum]SMP17834.1 Thioredoxin domain-containing protein [Desulfurobacterium pacificum]